MCHSENTLKMCQNMIKLDKLEYFLKKYIRFWIWGYFSVIESKFLTAVVGYIDPGNGSLLIQIIITGILSMIYVLKNFWKKLYHKVINKFKGK